MNFVRTHDNYIVNLQRPRDFGRFEKQILKMRKISGIVGLNLENYYKSLR